MAVEYNTLSAQLQSLTQGRRSELNDVLDSRLMTMESNLRRDLSLEIRHQVDAISAQLKSQGTGKLSDIGELLELKLKGLKVSPPPPKLHSLDEISALLDKKLEKLVPSDQAPAVLGSKVTQSLEHVERTLESLERVEHKVADELHELEDRLSKQHVPATDGVAIDVNRTIDLELFNTLADLPFEGDVLSTHMMLVPEGCQETVAAADIAAPQLDLRRVGIAGGELAKALHIEGRCPEAVCLWRGDTAETMERSIKRFSTARGESLTAWAERECEHVEVGFRNMGNEVVNIFWLHPTHDERVFQGQVMPKGEVFWRTARLGHQFVAVSAATNAVERQVTVEQVVAVYQMPVPAANDGTLRSYEGGVLEL